ncbi:MAG TPA: Uma2 family endonuclease, partial [Blastocatellia bacterium]
GLVGNRLELDFATDPPPDIAVEVDIHHDSRNKLDIYAGLGVPEVWRFDGVTLTIHLLDGEVYRVSSVSKALQFLTGSVLTGFLVRLPEEGETATVRAFDEWLRTAPQP